MAGGPEAENTAHRERKVFEQVVSNKKKSGPRPVAGGGDGPPVWQPSGVAKGVRANRSPEASTVGGVASSTKQQGGGAWWDSRPVQRYLQNPPGGRLSTGVSLKELCSLLEKEANALDKVLDGDGTEHLRLSTLMMGVDGSGSSPTGSPKSYAAAAGDARTLALAEAEETRGLLKWMLTNMCIMRDIEMESPGERQANHDLAIAKAQQAALQAGGVGSEDPLEVSSSGDVNVAAILSAETASEVGIPAALSSTLQRSAEDLVAESDAAIVHQLKPGGEVRLGPLQLAAHACLAEMEQAAAADAELFRGTDLMPAAVELSHKAIEAAKEKLQSSTTAKRELESTADNIFDGLKKRIEELWAACGLSPSGLEAVLEQAMNFAEGEAASELAVAKAAAGVSGGVAFVGGGGGGVVLGNDVIGCECAQLACLLAAVRRHALRTKSAMMVIGQRELLVRHLRLSCARLAPMHALANKPLVAGASAPPKEIVSSLEAEIVSTVALLRQATVRVVEAVVAWRGGLTSQAPFAAPLDNSGNRSSLGGGGGGRGIWTPNYLLHMATDLDDITELSAEMPGVLHEAPSRLDRRRLWRARQAIDLEPQTTQRAIRQILSSNSESSSGGVSDGPTLRWQPVQTSELKKVAGVKEVDGCLFEIAAESDEVLIAELEASGNGMLAGARVGGVELPAS